MEVNKDVDLDQNCKTYSPKQQFPNQVNLFMHNSYENESSFYDTRKVETNVKIFSKSYDYTIYREYQNSNNPTPMLRSQSEDILQSKQEYHKWISVTSTKGRLFSWQKIKPGDKILRSLSIGQKGATKLPHKVSEESLKPKPKTKFTNSQKLVVVCLCFVDFTSFLSMSIIAPFFPREAAAKGMREAVSGIVFSIYAFVVMLSSPIFGKLIPTVGAKYMFLTGVLFAGFCNILFGLLDRVDGTTEFTVLCFVVRSFEALGAAAYSTASCTILIDQFPDDIGTVFGFTETCLGIGMSIGPAIGGALYSAGGFGLPFFTLGIFAVLTAPIGWYMLRSVPDPVLEVNSNVSYRKLLSMPHVIVVCIILVIASQAQGFIDPTLEPHMRQYNLNPGIIGLLFLLLSGSYAIASPIVGWISGKCRNKYPLMIIGLSLLTVSLLLLGPSSILPISGSVWLSIVALILLGITFAAAYVPTFESMFIAAMNGGLEDDITTYSIVSGLWNSMYSFGEVIGPSLGGVLSDFFTFPEASSYIALLTAAACVVAIFAWLNPCLCFGPIGLVEMDDEDDSSSEDELLSSNGTKQSSLPSPPYRDYGTLLKSESIP